MVHPWAILVTLSHWAEWPERALISPIFNTHTTTDKEVVHRYTRDVQLKSVS